MPTETSTKANLLRQFPRTARRYGAPREYATEELLVSDIMDALQPGQCPWGSVRYIREFDYRTGRTDLVVLGQSEEVIAFEAKLLRWRVAMHQAFRNTFFAHQSYVVLPEEIANIALAHGGEFDVRSIGLCTISSGILKVLLPAPTVNPINAWLGGKAAAMIRQANGNPTH